MSYDPGVITVSPWWLRYFDLGPVQIPPLAQPFGMTDRTTGTVYYPSIATDGTHIQFTTQAPPGTVKIFGPWDGPFVGNYYLRMGIAGGHVVVDTFPADAGPGPFIRSGSTPVTLAAVLYGVNTLGGAGFDHLQSAIAPVQGSIFDPTP